MDTATSPRYGWKLIPGTLLLLVGLTLGPGILPLTADCGCEKMEIQTGEFKKVSRVYCAPAGESVPMLCKAVESDICAPGQTPYQCDLGVVNPSAANGGALGWSFQVVATLTSGSSIQQCTHGQFVSQTYLEDGKVVPNPEAQDEPPMGTYQLDGGMVFSGIVSPNQIPAFETRNDQQLVLGADGYYSSTDVFEDSQAGKIYWDDQPAVFISPDDEAHDLGGFLAFVQNQGDGSPDCWCYFSIQRTWVNGEPGGAGPKFLEGSNCVFNDPD